MFREGDEVIVKGSRGFNSIQLGKVSRRRGVIQKIVRSEGKSIAAYVSFKKNKGGSVLVPIKCLESAYTINQIRTMSILKNTTL